MRDVTDTLGDELEPARALLHPTWLAALILLVVNDHVLKPTGWAPVVTGKLSDVAGLIVAPVLLAVILRCRTSRAVWGAGAIVAVVFSAINLSASAASAWSHVPGLLGFRWETTVDPTDLLALPAIPLGLRIFERRMRRQAGGWQRGLAAWLAVGGAVACLASSPPQREDPPPRRPEPFRARVALLNETHELQVVRVRRLKPGVELDCDRVAEAPELHLTDEVFAEPVRWELLSSQQIGLGVPRNEAEVPPLSEQGCRAVRIASEVAPDVVVFWSGELQPRAIRPNPEGDKGELARGPTVVMTADYSEVAPDQVGDFGERPCPSDRTCTREERRRAAAIPEGAEYGWDARRARDLVHELPDRNERERRRSPASCRQPVRRAPFTWDAVPTRWRQVRKLQFGPDGCHTLSTVLPDHPGREGGPGFNRPDESTICAPRTMLEILQPRQGRTVFVRAREVTAEASGAGGLKFDIRVLDTDGDLVNEGDVYLLRGAQLPDRLGVGLAYDPAPGCGPSLSDCGRSDLAARVRTAAKGRRLVLGEAIEIDAPGSPTRRLYLNRALYRVVSGPEGCERRDSVSEVSRGSTGPFVEVAATVGFGDSDAGD
ncbi:MAG: hypothetical protein ABEL76_02130 [Bradymonadaceae bacterium]